MRIVVGPRLAAMALAASPIGDSNGSGKANGRAAPPR